MNLNQLIGKKMRFYMPNLQSVEGVLTAVDDDFVTVEHEYTDITWGFKITTKNRTFFLNKNQLGKIKLL